MPPEPGVSRETEARLAVFAQLLLRWTGRINLIAAADRPRLWERHIADSLQLVPLLPPVARAIDLGSGGGFPGLVLAIATGIAFDLVEADQRKAAFLREAARATAAPVTVHAARIESLRLAPAGLVTARALAPLPRLLGWAAPLLAPGGILLLPKGAGAADELTAARAEWHMTARAVPSRTDPAATILHLSDLRRVPPEG